MRVALVTSLILGTTAPAMACVMPESCETAEQTLGAGQVVAAQRITQSDPVAPKVAVDAVSLDGLTLGVARCWNVGALPADALQTSVTVAASLSRDAKPDPSSIRMIQYSGGTLTNAKQAFEAARRAIIRCGVKGFDLPIENYAQWREIEMTFNPERMRIK